MARLGKEKKKQKDSVKKESGLETPNDAQKEDVSDEALAPTKKNRVKVYKTMTMRQALLKDAKSRRQQIKKANKLAQAALIDVRQGMHRVFANVSKHHHTIVKMEQEMQRCKPVECENKIKRHNTVVSWKPTPSNTVNILFDDKPRVHEPLVDRSALEWEELRFLSPRSFRSHQGRRWHESKKPTEFKRRTEFYTHVPQNDNGVFQYHRPLSARQNPNYYENHSKRRQRPSTAVAKTSMIKYEKRKRTHRHFRYHLHAQHMTTFNSEIAQNVEPYTSILQQRVLEASKCDRTSANLVRPSKNQNSYLVSAPSRPQTAKARFAYVDATKASGPERMLIQKQVRQIYNSQDKIRHTALKTRAYGHYNTEKETMKHDDVIQAFLVSKSNGKYIIERFVVTTRPC